MKSLIRGGLKSYNNNQQYLTKLATMPTIRIIDAKKAFDQAKYLKDIQALAKSLDIK